VKSQVLNTFVTGWIRIFDGLLMVLSLGFYYSNTEIRWLVWSMERRRKVK
jgi:hypothetical protein